jgi:hypothetical protein
VHTKINHKNIFLGEMLIPTKKALEATSEFYNLLHLGVSNRNANPIFET